MMMMMKPALVYTSLAAAALFAGVSGVPAQSGSEPVVRDEADSDGYLVVYKSGVSQQTRDLHEAHVHKRALDTERDGVKHSFQIGDLHGYHLDLHTRDLDNYVHDSDLVKLVERDTYVSFNQTPRAVAEEPDHEIETLSCGEDGVACQDVSRIPGLWGLARLSHPTLSDGDYIYDKNADVSESWAYVIDTGIYAGHPEFKKNQVVWGANYVTNIEEDDNGHGTHVAGIVGGRNVGVAKGAKLVSVKVLDADQGGRISNVIKGIAWSVKDAKDRGVAKKTVINMSFCGDKSPMMNEAVKAAHDEGILTVAAAGNEGRNADNFSPSSEPSALVVGAMNKKDERPAWSNYGDSVEIFAPGESIMSAWIGNGWKAPAYKVMSGTSMAAPHVSGMILYLMSLTGVHGPKDVKDLLDFLGLSVANSEGYQVKNAKSPVAVIAYNGAFGV